MATRGLGAKGRRGTAAAYPLKAVRAAERDLALLSDAAAQAISDACNAKISYGFVSSTVGATNESLSNDSPSSGSCFRYDVTAHQFIYNLSTTPMATGSWTIKATVTMADGSVISHDVNIGVR
jgi:hypothetical protein